MESMGDLDMDDSHNVDSSYVKSNEWKLYWKKKEKGMFPKSNHSLDL